MPLTSLKSKGLLLLTSMIWGSGFVAQRIGMEHMGPFAFNGIRFALGAAVVLPFCIRENSRKRLVNTDLTGSQRYGRMLLVGLALFVGASLQQVGIIYTTAGKAGFITGLYVVIVPILGIFVGRKSHAKIWVGALLAVVGLYFLAMTEQFVLGPGDTLVGFCAIAFAVHVLSIDWTVRYVPALQIAFAQFSICALLSLITAVIFEPLSLSGILAAAVPMIYSGIFSIGVAYTLQVVAQKNVHPAHAAIILSLEAVFAVAGGWLILGETLTVRAAIGCLLMLTGMLISQLSEGEKA